MKTVIPLIVVVCMIVACSEAKKDTTYVNEWVVAIDGDENAAREVAETHGFVYLQKVGDNHKKYHFLHAGKARKSKRSADALTNLLETHPKVISAKQQELKIRVKRSAIQVKELLELRRKAMEIQKKLEKKTDMEDNKDEMIDEKTGKKMVIPNVDVLSPDYTGDDFNMPFNDPLYHKQWYLHSTGQGGAAEGMDLNVVPAWKLGYTGQGVVVSIVDDGVDGTHPDLDDNFFIDASYDFNNLTDPFSNHPGYHDGDTDPHPNDNPLLNGENDHGTKCAGEVGAEANNGVCGVGVAYGVSLGGIRLLDGPVTDAIEAAALSYHNNIIDIYSCCWGPTDDGETFEGAGEEAMAAIEGGITKGRDGRGNIYVWASGNGGLTDDDCAADGYVSSIYTIAIGAITGQGHSAFFIESCSPVMAVTLVGSTHNPPHGSLSMAPDNWVVTTDLNHKCTEHFTGTSSAAPFATGAFAIVLEANPNLTWRDLQHIVARGCNIPNPTQEGWYVNGAGFHLNHKFGFGLLDVSKMVELALTWENVGPQITYEVPHKPFNVEVEIENAINMTLTIKEDCPITKLEHTQAHITFQSPRRGDISLFLYSPSGTKSELLSTRIWDSDSNGISDWPFMTVHNWGEDPVGDWTLEFRYIPSPESMSYKPVFKPGTMPRDQDLPKAKLIKMGMTLYGTEDKDSKEEDGSNSGGDSKQTSTPMSTAVHPEEAGKGDPDTIANIYNEEQASNEEIVIDLENLAQGVDLPPNVDNNMVDGQINTDEGFNGVVIDEDGNKLPMKSDSDDATKLNKIDVYAGDPDPQFNEALDPRDLQIIIDVLSRHLGYNYDALREKKQNSRYRSEKYQEKAAYPNTSKKYQYGDKNLSRDEILEKYEVKVEKLRRLIEAKEKEREKKRLMKEYLKKRNF
ncbi:neuroendocrine convertase 2-like [Glandiceps talaboti]